MKIKSTLLPLTILLNSFIMLSCSSKPSLPDGVIPAAKYNNEEFLLDDSTINDEDNSPEIRPGYLIRLNSSGDEKLTGTYRVNIDSELSLPYKVQVDTKETTLSTLSQKINESYKKFFKKGSQIKVSIAERQYLIEVRGLVQKPGQILVKRHEKLESLINKSGDFNLSNEARVMQIMRGKNTFYVNLPEYFQGKGINKSPVWYGGEKVIFMSSANLGDTNSVAQSIQILGDVRTPGPISFINNADLYQYLVKAGGTTSTSDLDRVQVARLTPQGRFVTQGSAEDVAHYIRLQPGDTVLMGSTYPGQYERNIQLGSLIATILSTIGILIIAL